MRRAQAAVAPVRQAGVDAHHRHAAHLRLMDMLRPAFTFHEDHEIGRHALPGASGKPPPVEREVADGQDEPGAAFFR